MDNPGHLKFLKIVVQIPPPWKQSRPNAKSYVSFSWSNAPIPRENKKSPYYFFNYVVAS